MAGTHALALTSYLAGQRLQAIDSLERRTEKLLSALAQHDDPLDGIEPNSQLLIEMLSAAGFAMAIGNDVVIAGDAPDFEGMSVIDSWFLNEGETVYCTDHIESLFPSEIALLASASGFMAIKARSQRSGWVRFYWFRPQEPEEVAWAGNPDKPVVEKAGALRLSPRRSFERWVEIRTGYSRPWSSEERMTAAKFRNTLLRWL
jgi:light-regulated signal transduction histidine kinase (bacteriophytochrome)